jgi:hypothetical protein
MASESAGRTQTVWPLFVVIVTVLTWTSFKVPGFRYYEAFYVIGVGTGWMMHGLRGGR